MSEKRVDRAATRNQIAAKIIKERGGIISATQAFEAGIHPATLYGMRDKGVIEPLTRGIYRLSGSKPLGNPDLVTVASRIPKGVICLISALAFHNLTTQIPHEVHVALPRGAEEPRLDHPPIRTYRFSAEAFKEGVETHKLDGVSVRVYNPEKTIADCFKFRNSVGIETAIEALRFYRDRKAVKIDKILEYAKVCRVEKIIRPYLEALF